MGTYIISIAATTVISAVITMLTPEKWSKYVGVVTGLVVTVCIARPIISIMQSDVLDGFNYTVSTTQSKGDTMFRDELKKELENRIDEDVSKRLKSEFNADCNAKSEVEISETGEVKGVSSIYVSGDKIDAVAIGRLREVYGAKEVKYVGVKKTAQKPE